MAFVLLMSLTVSEPPKPPTLDAVRIALKENLDRIKNRKIKYVWNHRPGPPKEPFPAIDDSERAEMEFIRSADGRWWDKTIVYRGGVPKPTHESACDGRRTIDLEGLLRPGPGPTRHALIGRQRPSSEGIHIEPHIRLHEMLGIRSSVARAPGDQQLVVLVPLVDDRASFRTRHLLDPAKNLWPVQIDSELADGKGGWRLRSRTKFWEFMPGPTLYPKRVTTWRPEIFNPEDKKLETTYHTIVSAEFSERFDDAAFAISIPEGARVRDDRTGREYYEGGGDVEGPKAPPPEHPLLHRLRQATLEDWVIHGGLAALAIAAAVGCLRLMDRKRKSNK